MIGVESRKLTGAYLDPTAGRVTLAAFAQNWLAAQTFDASTRETTATRIRVHLLPSFGARELRSLKPSDVQAWLRGRQQELAPSYVRGLLGTLSAILYAAVDDGVLATNPCSARAVRAPRPPQRRIEPWSAAQVHAVVAALPPRSRTLAVVGAGLGLRQGEIFGLRVSDVDFLRHRVHVEQQVKIVSNRLVVTPPPKGGKTRTVPLPDVVAVALSEHLRQYPAGADGLIFTSRERKPLNRNYVNSHVWKPALRAADVPDTRENGMHSLRHYFASVLIDAGESAKAVAEYLGHADPGFTLRVYAHLFPASEDRARRAVDAALGGAATPPARPQDAAGG